MTVNCEKRSSARLEDRRAESAISEFGFLKLLCQTRLRCGAEKSGRGLIGIIRFGLIVLWL